MLAISFQPTGWNYKLQQVGTLLGEYVRVLLRQFRLLFFGASKSGTFSTSTASIEGKAHPKPVLVARDVFSLASRCRKVWGMRETEGD